VCQPAWNGSSAATWSAASSPTGRVSPTTYYLSNSPAQITVVRRHHPLQGRTLDVLSAGKDTVVVRFANGSKMRFPPRWMDADGARQCPELQGDSRFCLIGLGELLKLVDMLRRCTAPFHAVW